MLTFQSGRRLALALWRGCIRVTLRPCFSSSISVLALATVSKHSKQMESKEPSLFRLCGKKTRKSGDHRICLSFWGEPPTYRRCAQEDVQFSSRQLCLLRQPSSRTLPVPMQLRWKPRGCRSGMVLLSRRWNRLEEPFPTTIAISMIFIVYAT